MGSLFFLWNFEGPQSQRLAQDPIYRLALVGTHEVVSPFGAMDPLTYRLARQMWWPLFFKSIDGSLKPGLAESYSLDLHKSQVQIKLKKNLLWSDGTEIGLKDLKWSMDYVQDPKYLSAHLRPLFRALESVKQLGQNTYVYHFKEGQLNYENFVSFVTQWILPVHAYGPGGFEPLPKPSKFITSGPIQASYKADRRLEIIWAPDEQLQALKLSPPAQKHPVLVKFYLDMNDALRRLNQNLLDGVWGSVEPQNKTNPSSLLGLRQQEWVLGFNQSHSSGGELRVALLSEFPCERIPVFLPQAEASGFCLQAQALGQKKKLKSEEKIKLIYTSPAMLPLLSLWKQALASKGIDLVLKRKVQFKQQLKSEKWHIYFSEQPSLGAYSPPLWGLWGCGGVYNALKICVPEITELLGQVSSIWTPSKRYKIGQNIYKLLLEQRLAGPVLEFKSEGIYLSSKPPHEIFQLLRL